MVKKATKRERENKTIAAKQTYTSEYEQRTNPNGRMNGRTSEPNEMKIKWKKNCRLVFCCCHLFGCMCSGLSCEASSPFVPTLFSLWLNKNELFLYALFPFIPSLSRTHIAQTNSSAVRAYPYTHSEHNIVVEI